MDQEIVKSLESIKEKRNFPTLVIRLRELKKYAPLELAKLLSDKNFSDLDVILQTPGGDIDAAYLIAKILRRHAHRVNIFVPLMAKSAGTLIAISADKIYLSDMSELGPLDTQIPENIKGQPEYKSALNGFKALSQIQAHNLETVDLATKLFLSRSALSVSEAINHANSYVGNTSRYLYDKFDPSKIGEYARYLEIGERYGINLLVGFKNIDQESAEKILKELVYGFPSHEFVIDVENLQELGFDAERPSDEICDILDRLGLGLLETKGDIIQLYE